MKLSSIYVEQIVDVGDGLDIPDFLRELVGFNLRLDFSNNFHTMTEFDKDVSVPVIISKLRDLADELERVNKREETTEKKISNAELSFIKAIKRLNDCLPSIEELNRRIAGAMLQLNSSSYYAEDDMGHSNLTMRVDVDLEGCSSVREVAEELARLSDSLQVYLKVHTGRDDKLGIDYFIEVAPGTSADEILDNELFQRLL
jgi:hypothetical protein